MDNNNNIPNSFDLPEDYFKKSKTGILNKIEWMQEHEAYPILSKLGKESGFIVPQNYFSVSASKLELLHTPTLSTLEKQNAFEVPSNYFEQTKLSIVSRIEDGNELSAYPTLHKLEKVNPFVTGENYFETSKQTIINTNKGSGGAKIISMNRKALWFAAAAVLMITFSLWIYNSYFVQPIDIDNCNTLACMEKRDLVKFKYENFDTEELLEAVDINKLEKNLNKTEQTDSLKTADSTDEALLDLID